MKICILSDSHDHVHLLNYAVAEAVEMGAEVILHCGDVVAPSTLGRLRKYQLPVHIIHGNNTGDLYTLGQLVAEDNQIEYHGMDATLELGGRRIFMVHYPHYARAMAATGDWDLVCCGHTHKISMEEIPSIKGGVTPLINPGTIGGVGHAPATYVMGELGSMHFVAHEISKKIEHSPAG
jgi:uncharacterized protein